MNYVFDSSSFIVLGHFYPDRFPTLWSFFNGLTADGRVLSVREVRRETENQGTKQTLDDWIKANQSIFLSPSNEETAFIRQMFLIPRFQSLIKIRQVLKGEPAADPFVIASAFVRKACVVTEETEKPNAVKIPNVCGHFGIECTNLEGLMEKEGWRF